MEVCLKLEDLRAEGIEPELFADPYPESGLPLKEFCRRALENEALFDSLFDICLLLQSDEKIQDGIHRSAALNLAHMSLTCIPDPFEKDNRAPVFLAAARQYLENSDTIADFKSAFQAISDWRASFAGQDELEQSEDLDAIDLGRTLDILPLLEELDGPNPAELAEQIGYELSMLGHCAAETQKDESAEDFEDDNRNNHIRIITAYLHAGELPAANTGFASPLTLRTNPDHGLEYPGVYVQETFVKSPARALSLIRDTLGNYYVSLDSRFGLSANSEPLRLVDYSSFVNAHPYVADLSLPPGAVAVRSDVRAEWTIDSNLFQPMAVPTRLDGKEHSLKDTVGAHPLEVEILVPRNAELETAGMVKILLAGKPLRVTVLYENTEVAHHTVHRDRRSISGEEVPCPAVLLILGALTSMASASISDDGHVIFLPIRMGRSYPASDEPMEEILGGITIDALFQSCIIFIGREYGST